MVSERLKRRIDAFLDEADEAASSQDWQRVAGAARAVLAIDPDNTDALGFLRMAEANGVSAEVVRPNSDGTPAPAELPKPSTEQPASFAGGRYEVRRFLGEGGKKRVFLAHDTQLDRNVAFSLIKADGLDETGRERITREAQAMGRLSSPQIVSIHDIGQHEGQPYLVQELMSGGDVEGLLEDGTPSLARTLEIAKDVCRGLAFAHERGIVHRDLKPGNVWLTEDGTAKIGDFGLAVSLDRSRLTQHGMMVGTVAYMPPEQALGGEVTPQADLYSLGAMLYELVTGRPPFQADDPTAIISQHINTPPVAPSWHSEHCPPDLEALILRLLAKVPADRPASANEVLTALEAVDPEARSASHSDSRANPLDRLARGIFVGRERELERLRAAFDETFSGRGSVVMLVGEPGIGKTRTVQELGTYARMRGAQVFWGRVHESEGAPPYWPWIQVGRAYRDQTLEETRRKEWQPYAPELQLIFPGLRDLFPGLAEPPPLESEAAQFRLFDAWSSFLRSVSERTPLLVALDDLHWAERPTLTMLTHLARDLGHSRILVLGTYRDTDLDRTHPLSRTLAELNREQLFVRLPLRGLSVEEVAQYVRGTTGIEPARQLVARIHEETEGNPFFLSEVVNLMAEEGTLSAHSLSDVAIPEGVREALGRRLDRLSPEANELLSLAAVLGREFTHEQLVVSSGHADDDVLRMAEEALAARVFEETGELGGYRFTHALMQETLLGELSAARRVRIHGQLAEALEALYGQAAESRAPELARHFAESSALNRAHAGAAARYARLAAEQAAAALAFDEAVEHYERCIELVEQAPDHLGEDEGALWLELALARFPTASLGDALPALDRALALFREQGAAASAAHAWMRTPALNPWLMNPRVPSIHWTLDSIATGDSIERCHLLALRAYSSHYFDEAAAAEDAANASAMAARLGLRTEEYPLALRRYEAISALGQGRFDDVSELAKRDERLLLESGAPLQAALFAGDVAKVLSLAERRRAESTRQGYRAEFVWGTIPTARVAWSQGERDRARELVAAIPTDFSTERLAFEAETALESGDVARALALKWDTTTPAGELGERGIRARCYLALGDYAAAHAQLDLWIGTWADNPIQASVVVGVPAIGALGDTAWELAPSSLREELLAYLSRYPRMRSSYQTLANPDEMRGHFALSLDRVEEAERHFTTGLAWATDPSVGFHVDAGRCHQGLAEVAERRGDHALAMQHLDAAGELFSRHGAKLYLDQVLAKKEILRA